MNIKVAIGQDSHRFVEDGARDVGNAGDAGETTVKPLLLGGVEFSGAPPLEGNSDADVVLHALCNAVSGVTGVNVLGETADRMLRENGITDSAEYLKEALRHLDGAAISHISFSVECSRPILSPKIDAIRENIAKLAGIPKSGVGITATSGEGLTDFGRGLGIGVMCVVTVIANNR